jgi:LIM domain kinase 1
MIPSLLSILTVRASPISRPSPPNRPLPAEPDLDPGPEPALHPSGVSAASYYTASEEVSIAAATEGGSSLQVHRFTLVKPGTMAKQHLASPSGGGGHHHGWSALDFFFASGLLPGGGGGSGARCDICHKRLGRKAALECDDCGLRAHIKCGEVAPRDCGLRSASSLTGTSLALSTTMAMAVGGKNKSK